MIRFAGAVGAAVVLTASSVPALAQTPPGPAAEASQLAQAAAMGRKCAWLAPMDATVLDGFKAERIAAVSVQSGDAAAAAATAAATAAARAAAAGPCSDLAKPNVQAMAQNLGFIILLRLDAMLAAGEPYAAALTTTDPYRAAIHAEAENLRAAASRSGQSDRLAQLAAVATQDARADLGLICAERRTVRAPAGPRACPAVTATEEKALPYVRAQIANAETVAPLIAQSYAQAVGPRPAQAAAAPSQADRDAQVAAERAAYDEAQLDKALAKHPDMDRFWKLDDQQTSIFSADGSGAARCTLDTYVYDMKQAIRGHAKTYDLIYLPTMKPDDAKPLGWVGFAVRRDGGTRGRVMEVRRYSTAFKAGELENALRQGKVELVGKASDSDDADIAGSAYGMMLMGIETNVLADSVDGKKPEFIRQCQGR